MFESGKSRVHKVFREEIQNGIELSGISNQIQNLRVKIEALNYTKDEDFWRETFNNALENVRQGDVEGTLRCIRKMQVLKNKNGEKILKWAAALRKEIIRQNNDEMWGKCQKHYLICIIWWNFPMTSILTFIATIFR